MQQCTGPNLLLLPSTQQDFPNAEAHKLHVCIYQTEDPHFSCVFPAFICVSSLLLSKLQSTSISQRIFQSIHGISRRIISFQPLMNNSSLGFSSATSPASSPTLLASKPSSCDVKLRHKPRRHDILLQRHYSDSRYHFTRAWQQHHLRISAKWDLLSCWQ
jgi:hypothetical protein